MSSSRYSFAVALVVAAAGGAVLLWPRLATRSRQELPSATVAASASPPPSPPPAQSAPPPSAPPPGPPLASADPRSETLCPADMVLVEGKYCPYVAHRCARHLGVQGGDDPRCERFEDLLICDGRPTALRFCIDRFEYPNLRGAKPVVGVSYHQAKRACSLEGKRLCEAEEWIFACEGARTRPYPTGLVRDAGGCNLDRVPRKPDATALASPFDVSVEMQRLDQRVPSGSAQACVSPFGVYDTVGNVAEWVHNREGKEHVAPLVTALAGGHWERAAGTCRRLDGAHGASHRSHRTGFRCCADPSRGGPVRRLLPKGTRLARRRSILPPDAVDAEP